MVIIKITKEELKSIKCLYGIEDKFVNTSDKVIKYINKLIKKKKYFFNFIVNNDLMGIDPAFRKPKKLKIFLKDRQYTINEGNLVFFNIKLSFDVIFKNEIDKIGLSNYNYATIFGKGPTFRMIDKNKELNELRCAINQASNVAKDVDFLCMNDHHNIFKIDLDTYKNLKYLLIPEYLHINQQSCVEGYFVNILEYLDGKFFGNLIVYNLITSKKKTPYFIDLKTAKTSGNNCFEFICINTKIKKVDIYGMAKKSKNNYNNKFVGNGNYTDFIIDRIIKVLDKCSDEYKVKYLLN